MARAAPCGLALRPIFERWRDMKISGKNQNAAGILAVAVLSALAAWSAFAATSDAAAGPGPMDAGEPWADANSVLVYRQRFEKPDAEGLRILFPADVEARDVRVTAAGEGIAGQAQTLSVFLQPEASVHLGVNMPETDPNGLVYRFALKVETASDWEPANRTLAMTLNQAVSIGDSIYDARPLEFPEVRDSVWLERATETAFKKHQEYLYRGWTTYEGSTSNAFLRRYDDRAVGQPINRIVSLRLWNISQQVQEVTVSIADIEVIRRDVAKLREMQRLLAVESPYIVATRPQILRARERVGDGMTMPAPLVADLRLANQVLAQPTVVHRKQAAWPGPERCLTEACKTILSPAAPEGYRCPACSRLHTGERFDGLLAYEHHKANGQAVRALGFAWQGYDDRKYLEKAEDILLAYAVAIQEFPLGHNWLGDCWLMEDFVIGYDFIRAALPQESRQRIEQDFLMAMVRRIHHYNHHYPEGYMVLWRICTWCAILARDENWINYLVFSPAGNREVLLRYGLTDDFLSLKGAAYHGDIVRSVNSVGQSLENCGVRFFDSRLEPLYAVLPKQLFPDGSLPAFGHSNVGLRADDYQVEIPYRYYRRAAYLALTPKSFRGDSSARIFWDETEIPAVRPLLLPSTNFRASGLTMLRTADNSTAVAVSWGAPKRNDPSRLDFQYYGAGGQLIWGSGITDYGNPLFTPWYQQSLSRNGIIVDRQAQEAVPAELVAVDLKSPDKFVIYLLQDGFADTRWVRAFVLLEDGGLIVIDMVSRSEPATIDLVNHLPGVVNPVGRVLAVPAGSLGGTHGYELLADRKMMPAAHSHAMTVVYGLSGQNRRGLNVTLCASRPSELFIAEGFTGHAAARSPVAIARVKDVNHIAFGALYEPFTARVPVHGEVRVAVDGADSTALRVRRGQTTAEIRLRAATTDTAPSGAAWRLGIKR